MNIYSISVRGLIFNFLLFIFVFYILKNQLFLEDSVKIYEFYIFYLAMYFFNCVAKIDLYFDNFFKINKKIILLIICFYFSVFFYEYLDNILYNEVKFLYPIPTEDDILNSNRWNLNNPLFFIIAFFYAFLFIFIILYYLSFFEPLFFWFFSFCIFICLVNLFKLINKEKNKSSKKEPEYFYIFNPFVLLLFLLSILIMDSENLEFYFKLISYFSFLLIGKYLSNERNIKLEKKVKEFFSKRATNKPFIKPEKSASKTIMPIIKKENHVIEKGFSFNFSERLIGVFTLENIKNNQILSSLLFLNVFIFLVDVERFFGIYSYDIWLFYSLIILPAYFIGKNIKTIKSKTSLEEILILLFKGSAWIFLSILLVIIGLFLFNKSKLSLFQIFPSWFQNVFLVWQIYYLIALIILQTILILLSYFYFKIKKDKIL